ncbi:hypothetical protein Tsubulata_016625 [Turnera subulata]|uniref:Uncharacterized protein n=1 Tax=Turnera subulata TaxID=218843 RepID=A0A9Q0JAR0_9ROSI|nr:hypothetical protein Tsubulata_016625 [Turnera subulata]
MVSHMGICNVMKHLVEDAVISVHRRQSSPEPIPLGRIVVREIRVAVVQERDQHNCAIGKEYRHPIYAHQPSQPFCSGNLIEHKTCSKKTSIRDVNLQSFPVCVQRAIRIIVAGKTIVFPASQVECQVQIHPHTERDDDSDGSAYRVVKVLGILWKFGFRLWDKVLVPFHG